ncbi:unnamed protein product [Echinostoma caproni]|uniref:CYCLIN domain-containing protein n=1 Tax=Echinostoma caproni TaxID=27848 RepID=A0A183BH47_9TREM|nr:unnamed protein product [Echinostoma caproni]
METSGRSVYEQEVDQSNDPPGSVPQPLYDPYFSANEKVIQDLLLDERRYHSTPGYCFRQPRATAKWMRRTLLNWLRDIYRHRNADAGVLSHAAQLTDRYLHVVPTDRHEYQLVGGTCYLVASKLNDALPATAVDMAHYMADSAKPGDIRAKEMTICIALQWDLTCITPVDFVAPVIEFLEFAPSLKKIIRQRALNTYVKAFHGKPLVQNFYIENVHDICRPETPRRLFNLPLTLMKLTLGLRFIYQRQECSLLQFVTPLNHNYHVLFLI